MHRALQAPELSHISRIVVTYAWASLSSQGKVARAVCRKCTRLPVPFKEKVAHLLHCAETWRLGAGVLAMGHSGGGSSSQQGGPRSSTMRTPL